MFCNRTTKFNMNVWFLLFYAKCMTKFSCNRQASIVIFTVIAFKFQLYCVIFGCFLQFCLLYHICVHYIEAFFTIRTKKSVHCSELRGVHYIEVYLQQKSIGRLGKCVQTGGVHYVEVFTEGGFTVICRWSSLTPSYIYMARL